MVNNWLRGVKAIGDASVRNIETKLKLPGWFDKPTPIFKSNFKDAEIGTIKVPLVSYVQAGTWTKMVMTQEKEEFADWLLTDLALSTNAFALEIKGDSMQPEFKAGDRVIIDPEIYPRPGDFVVAKNGEEEATFKKYRPRSIDESGREVFELVPLNSDYPTMRSDRSPIVIIGTMVEHRKYRKR